MNRTAHTKRPASVRISQKVYLEPKWLRYLYTPDQTIVLTQKEHEIKKNYSHAFL